MPAVSAAGAQGTGLAQPPVVLLNTANAVDIQAAGVAKAPLQNFVNCWEPQTGYAVGNQQPSRSDAEGSTTIPTGSRAKWLEARSTLTGDDIVCSIAKVIEG